MTQKSDNAQPDLETPPKRKYGDFASAMPEASIGYVMDPYDQDISTAYPLGQNLLQKQLPFA